MHHYIPAHNLKYMAYGIFIEGGLVLIMVELALNSTVKHQFIAIEVFRTWTFSAEKYVKFSFTQQWQKYNLLVILIFKLIDLG